MRTRPHADGRRNLPHTPPARSLDRKGAGRRLPGSYIEGFPTRRQEAPLAAGSSGSNLAGIHRFHVSNQTLPLPLRRPDRAAHRLTTAWASMIGRYPSVPLPPSPPRATIAGLFSCGAASLYALDSGAPSCFSCGGHHSPHQRRRGGQGPRDNHYPPGNCPGGEPSRKGRTGSCNTGSGRWSARIVRTPSRTSTSGGLPPTGWT